MDDTQRLDRNDDEEETSINRERPVSNLHMFAGIHGPARDFPIYHGQNSIGRHASCDITLPAQSVSKKHAILEVRGDCHTICDNGSLNKTRRGKAALTPNVRYALSHGDFLLFADVACRYTIEEKVEEETTGVEESEDDSVLVPGTQGALAIEKTPGAAIRRIARGAVLAKDSGDEDDDDEEGQTRWNEAGCGSVKDSHKTSAPGTDFRPDMDTVVPESDEENDTSTSETRLPSLNLQCDSDTDTSRRSSFVPSSQNISTPVALKVQSKNDGRTLTAADDKEIEAKKPADAKMTPRSAGEEKIEEQMAESTRGGNVSELCVEVEGTVDDKLKKEQECEKMLQDDAIKKPSSDIMPGGSPCIQDNLTSSRSETVQEAPCGLTPKEDDPMQQASVKVSDTDEKPTEDQEGIREEDTTTLETDVHPAETSGIQTNKAEEGGNGRSLGSCGVVFHMDSDTDEDEAAPTGSDLEKSKSPQIAHIEESEKASAPPTSRNEEDSDSDTDLEGDQNVIQSKSAVEKTVGEPIKTEETTGLAIESDTDDDADIPKQTETNADQDSRSNTEVKKEEFHLDSDTDVEEDSSIAEVTDIQAESPKASVKETKDILNLDCETDMDEEVDVPSSDVAHGPRDSSTASTSVQETTGVDSDTDVDEDDQKPGGANDTSADNEAKDQIAVSDVVIAKEAAALHVDSDTDVKADDDGLPVAPVTKVGSPEGITDSDGAKKDNEMTKEPADLHLDSDTNMEEGHGPSVVSRKVENQVDTSNIQKEVCVQDQKPSVSSNNAALSGNSAEEAKNVPAEICTEEDETQKSESESLDMDVEMMPTQCYLEPQEESDLPDEEEEATQAYIFSSTWAEPDPFKRPADPIGVLQISSVTLNSTQEDIDETALAETQAFFTEAEPIGPSVQETPEPVGRSVDETIQSSSSEDESGREVQQLSHENLSSEATQPVSQYLSTRPSEEAGTWLHLKREVPASVWIRGIQQEGSSTNPGDNETTKDATQTDEQSLKLELEATQLYSEESPSGEKPPVQTETAVAPAAGDENKEPEGPEKATEPTEKPCSEDTQVTDIDATQAYSLSVPDSEGTTQACSLSAETTGGDTTSGNSVATEEDSTQVVNPSITADEVAVPEMSSKSKEKPSRRGLSRSKKKEESAQSVPTSSETEEHPDKPSKAPESIREETDKPSAGESQISEPEIKEVRRRGGRRNAESLSKAPANEEVAATTSQKRTTKRSLEDEPLEINELRGRKQVSGRSAIKVVNEELKEEHEQSSSNTKELKESFAQEILPVNPPEEIESLTSEDNKGSTVEQMSGAQVSLENQEILSAEASTSYTVNEGKERMDSSDNSAEKSHSQQITENKKPARNTRQAATRPKKEEAVDTESVGNVEREKDLGGRNLRTTREKDASKQTSESLQSQQIIQEESQGRKATRKARAKASEPELDKSADIEENKAAEEVSPAEPVSGNEKSRRTRRSLKEEIKEEVENIPETKGKTRRSASVKDVQPKNEKEQGNRGDMPMSNKTPKRARNNSKEETTKPEQEVKEDVKTEEKEVIRKSRRIQKSQKEEQKAEDNIETQEIPSSDSQTSRRTRRDYREENVAKEESVKETTSRRTRRRSKEEEEVKLEDQTKKSWKARKDSKEETQTEETVEQSSIEVDKEETVGRKTTRKTRRNLKEDQNTSVHERESKQTEENSKPERSSRSRAKTSDESQESHGEVGVNKGAEESHKLSPPEEKSKPQIGRGRQAAKKEDIPQASTPVVSRKRGQPTKAEVEVKRKKSDDEEQELEVVETPRSRRGRPRKLATEAENTQTEKDISPPDPSPSRSTRQKASSALSNPQEARTPRRTNRTSISATSPYAQSGSPPKILFTGVVDTAGEEAIRSLGGVVADSVFDCTHLVTDRVRRTVKFLCALARGIPIVTLDWIDKCKKSRCFLSPTGFLVNDKEQEKNFSFVLSESLQKAKKHPLFEGYEIHVTANVKPEPDHMKDIIRCSGATFLPKMPRSFKGKCIIVSCPEDSARCKSVPTSVPITSAEFILSGILRQEVNPTVYLLNPAVQDTAPTPAKRRR